MEWYVHAERNRLIVAAKKAGATYKEAGAVGGVSGERARQICDRAERMAFWEKRRDERLAEKLKRRKNFPEADS